jgi:hypothetical protein
MAAEQQTEGTSGLQHNGVQGAASHHHTIRETARETMDKVRDESTTALTSLGDTLKAPATGAAMAGAAVTGAAVLFGLAPTAVGAAAGYIVFRICKKRQSQSG